jgi:hypothetical protein
LDTKLQKNLIKALEIAVAALKRVQPQTLGILVVEDVAYAITNAEAYLREARNELVRVPAKFYVDHEERSLPTPQEVRRTDRHVWVRRNDPELPGLLSDARYYAHQYGPDLCSRGLISSAKATVKAIESAMSASVG